ncbi:MAG: PAS domain-containing protein, partial [Bryobacterales bacterium]|nr:PAS domain-containing protein [Bryobacterales bacterium]
MTGKFSGCLQIYLVYPMGAGRTAGPEQFEVKALLESTAQSAAGAKTVRRNAQPYNIFRTVLDALRIPVHCVDNDLRIIYWNEAAARQTGYEPGDVLW